MPKSGPHQKKKTPPIQVGNNFIKNWRIYRELTVAQLAELTELSTGNISAIENRRQGFSGNSLDRIAAALKVTRGMLFDTDPLADGVAPFWQIWEKASASDRETLTIMANRLVETKGRK